MTAALLVLAAWPLVSLATALGIGRAIHLADHHQ